MIPTGDLALVSVIQLVDYIITPYLGRLLCMRPFLWAYVVLEYACGYPLSSQGGWAVEKRVGLDAVVLRCT